MRRSFSRKNKTPMLTTRLLESSGCMDGGSGVRGGEYKAKKGGGRYSITREWLEWVCPKLENIKKHHWRNALFLESALKFFNFIPHCLDAPSQRAHL